MEISAWKRMKKVNTKAAAKKNKMRRQIEPAAKSSQYPISAKVIEIAMT